MALQRMAIVKLDDYDTTLSKGGVVEHIVDWLVPGTNYVEDDPSITWKNAFEGVDGYKAVQSDTAQIGWILSDKEQILYNPVNS